MDKKSKFSKLYANAKSVRFKIRIWIYRRGKSLPFSLSIKTVKIIIIFLKYIISFQIERAHKQF